MGSIVSRPVVTTVGVLYPAYASFKAVESPGEKDDKQWLTYWIVFSITSSVEEVTEKVVSYVPGYYVIKCLFLIWLMLPKTRGAVVVYEKLLLPQLKKYEPLFDAKLLELKHFVDRCIADLKQNGSAYVKHVVEITIEKAKEVQDGVLAKKSKVIHEDD